MKQGGLLAILFCWETRGAVHVGKSKVLVEVHANPPVSPKWRFCPPTWTSHQSQSCKPFWMLKVKWDTVCFLFSCYWFIIRLYVICSDCHWLTVSCETTSMTCSNKTDVSAKNLWSLAFSFMMAVQNSVNRSKSQSKAYQDSCIFSILLLDRHT